jgi:glycosyltransferase involved in cell wall biosynthesis
MDSMFEADRVVVTDTGSTDDTVEKLRARGAVVYEETVKPWRFDVARNLSLSHVPEDADICVCTDLDERFVPGWREKLEQAWKNHRSPHAGPTARTGRYLYNWGFTEEGKPNIQIYYFKIHARHGFIWKCPIHEVVEYEGDLPLDVIFIDGMVLNHYADLTKSRASYLPLLELAVREEPSNARMHYYLGREYMYQGAWQKCIEEQRAYLALPEADWREERCAAMRHIGASYERLGNIREAYRWYWRAVGEAPHMRDAYIDFAKLCNAQRDWGMAFFLAKEALKIERQSTTFVNMGYAWDYTPDDICAISAYYMGLVDTALIHAKKALAYAPENVRLINNLKLIENALDPDGQTKTTR